MPILLSELVNYCEEVLNVSNFRDYCPNGLQVEGNGEVKKIISGVTASQALLDAAVEEQADLVLVHHGYFWKGEREPVVGIKQKRLKTLLLNNISLLAYHLPLDAHIEMGNNAQLAKLMGWPISAGLDGELGKSVGCLGVLPTESSAEEIRDQLTQRLARPAQLIVAGSRPVKTIAWCTGAAQGYIEKAYEAGADLYVSGEISEQTVHFAKEAGIHYIAAGHHATERYGVQALGKHLHSKFGVEHKYIEIDNPV
jgi:dinuclear metal center YbgI/SA1388 family protein